MGVLSAFFSRPSASGGRRLLVWRAQGSGDTYRWLMTAAGECGDSGEGDLADLAACRAAIGDCELLLMLSPDLVALRTVALSESERRHYRRLLPFKLEEELVVGPEALHFSYTEVADGQIGVAIIGKAALAEILAAFGAQGLAVDVVVPELLLLPWSADCWTWALRSGQVSGRIGPFDGFQVPVAELGIVEPMLPPSQTGEEDSLLLLLEPDQRFDDEHWRACLPGRAVETQTVDSLMNHLASRVPEQPFDLLQGEFAKPWRLGEIWRQWQPVAVLALVALVLQVGGLLYGFQAQKQLAEDLQAEKVALAREAFPRGKIHSPERQLRAATRQSANRGPTNLTALLSAVGPQLSGEAGYAVRSIQFDGRDGALRLEISAESFQQIERVRKMLDESGLRVKLLNSGARGDGVLARLEMLEGEL